MTWGYVAVGAGTLVGGYLAGQGAKSGANSQSQADQAAQRTQMQMFEQIQKNERPFISAGQGATRGLSELFGPGGRFNAGYDNFSFSPANIAKMPGYQFQLRQGDRALQSSDAATVGALSGPAMKDLISFNQGLAGQYEQQYYNQALQKYQTNQGNYYTNQQNIFNRLNQIATLGQNAAGNLGTQGAALGTGVAQAQAAQGAAIGAGQVGVANAYAGAAGNIPLYALLANSNSAGGGNSGTTPGNPMIPSDRRLKTDIKRIGKTDSGLPLYSYRYKDGPTYHIGPMADEVRERQPEAVFTREDGYDMVHYGMLR